MDTESVKLNSSDITLIATALMEAHRTSAALAQDDTPGFKPEEIEFWRKDAARLMALRDTFLGADSIVITPRKVWTGE